MKALEEVFNFNGCTVNFLDAYSEETMLIEKKLPLLTISYNPVYLVIHEFFFELLCDIVRSLKFLSVLVIQDLQGNKRLQ